MDVINLLFVFEGRVNRAKYWLAVAIWLGTWIAMAILMIAADFATFIAIIALLVFIPSAYSGIVVGIKRLHDRNKSGWWLLLFYLAPGVLDAVARGTGGAGMVFSIASLAISIWAIVELGCLRGTIGPNPFGPDPIAPKPATH